LYFTSTDAIANLSAGSDEAGRDGNVSETVQPMVRIDKILEKKAKEVWLSVIFDYLVDSFFLPQIFFSSGFVFSRFHPFCSDV
jgi:hypothetical protein